MDKTVTSFYKLYCSFALSDARIAEKQNALAVNLNENTVTGHTRRELEIQKGDHC